MSVAETILKQLGGRQFLAMTGAKDLLNTDNGLQFRIGRNRTRANKVRITLRGNDKYDLELFRVRGVECEALDFGSGLYADQLRGSFTRLTGLDCTL